jgi:hypothetical protein
MSDTVTAATTDAMMAAEVFNATPIDLEVWTDGTALADVPSLVHVSRSWPKTAALELRPKTAQRAIGLLRPPGEADTHLTIGPGDLHSVSGGGPVTATFVNNTNMYVDIYWVDWGGSQNRYAGPFAPGGRHDQGSYTDHVWAVRSTFTG